MSYIDKRGAWRAVAARMGHLFERAIPPWRRAVVRSASRRVVIKDETVRAIRGVHVETHQARDDRRKRRPLTVSLDMTMDLWSYIDRLEVYGTPETGMGFAVRGFPGMYGDARAAIESALYRGVPSDHT